MENFGQFASIMHDIILSLAILAGGIWTLITFNSLKSKNKAEAELSEILLNIEKGKRALVEQGVVEIEVKATQIPTDENENYCIGIVIKFTNKGNSATTLDLTSDDLIYVSEVLFDTNGNSALKPIKTQGGYHTDIMTIRAEAITKFTYFIHLSNNGLFVINVFTKAYERDSEIDKKVRGEEADVYWTGSTFVHVK